MFIITDFSGPALLFQQGCFLATGVKENSHQRRIICLQQSWRASFVFGLTNSYYTGIFEPAMAITELSVWLYRLDEIA